MNGTVLDHRLVRDYLGELDAATRGLPPAQARELREQISAHLDDALRSDAGDQEVAAVLRRLGPPASLAAEAGAAGIGAARTVAGPVRARLARVRPRAWKAAGLTAVLVVAGAWLGAARADHYWSAGPLTFTGNADWWYPQDVAHQHIRWAGNDTENTTTIRSGQRQAYLVQVTNDTAVTQTIIGPAVTAMNIVRGATGQNNADGGDSFGPGTQIEVSRSNADIANGVVGQDAAGSVTFGLPVAIPPFQTRLVRVQWISGICLAKGESTTIDQLNLRVRIGWFTRTELIPQQFWTLLGPSHGRCS
jgi:hypothetical protein